MQRVTEFLQAELMIQKLTEEGRATNREKDKLECDLVTKSH